MPKYLDYHGLQTFKDDLDIEFAKKVDKVSGKGLSTNDYTNTDKQKVADALVAADIAGKLDSTLKGAANGLAELDNAGKVPASQLPSYVDDVLEYSSLSAFPATGESGKIYVAKDTNKTYRWSGSGYVEISQGLTLGTTSSTAFRGDYGQAAYTHGVTNKGSAFTSGLYKITTNAEGHVTAASAVQKSDITGLGIPGSVPTNVSAFTNDAGYLTQHQDISGKIDVTEKGAANGVAELNANGIVPSDQLPANVSAFYNDAGYLTQHQDISGKIDATEKGVANGVASLDSSGKVPSSQLPAGQTTVSKIMMNSTEMPMDSSGVVDLGTVITQHQDISGKISVSEKGAAEGVAELDVNGKVPSSQLPSYVDDVEEYSSVSAFPAAGESGKVYVAQDTNVTYRWSGTEYVVIGSDLALGETASTAYRGDRGAAAYAAAVTNVESAPSSGSSNLITSGGVYDALPDVMTGATSSAAGASGLVPAPASGDDTKYLKGDGSWGEIVADPFTGATSSTAGTIGMVPAPSAGDQAKYLKADGTWGTVIADPFTGATSSTAGTTGMVPAPAAGDQMRVLTGGGTWEASPGAKLYTTDSLTVTNVSGSYSQTFLDENIGVDMQAVKLEVEDESVFNANITVTPANGSVTVACSDVSGTTTMKISLLKVIEDPTAVTSTEFTILNNRLLAVENVCTDTPVTIAVSDWSSSSPYTYTWESSLVTVASKIDVLLEDGSENAGIESFDFDRVTGGVRFTTSVLPTGNLPVTIRVVNAKIDENYSLTGANVATSVISGQTNVDGALSALDSSVSALNSKIISLTATKNWRNYTSIESALTAEINNLLPSEITVAFGFVLSGGAIYSGVAMRKDANVCRVHILVGAIITYDTSNNGTSWTVTDKSTYKAGDSVTFVNPSEFSGRLGWSKTRVIFSVPMDKKIDHFTSASLTGSIGVYADNTIKVCTATFNSATISNNILCLRYDITPASAWASSDDTSATVELNGSLTINF